MHNSRDKYGNNINFPDDIISDMTIKGLLGKWTEWIYSKAVSALLKYYMKTGNIDAGDKSFVISQFKGIKMEIDYLTPILEDLVAKEICGIEDIFIAVYGIKSDEVYVVRRFLDRCNHINEWDTDYMWNDCANDKRLLSILS